MEERETDYPSLTYRLVPRATTIRDGAVVWEREVEKDLPEDELGELVSDVVASEIGTLITAEQNFARFVIGISFSLREQALTLSTSLKQYQAEIQ